jgi:hypothetical protein
MLRARKPTIDSVLAELATVKSHIVEYAGNTASDATSCAARPVASTAVAVYGAARANALACVVGAIVLGLAAAGLRKVI